MEQNHNQKYAQPRAFKQQIFWGYGAAAAIVGVLIWSSFGTEMSFQNLIKGASGSVGFAKEFFPPNFSRLNEYIEQMLITIKMAVWGSALAAVVALPLSFLAAKNTSPSPLVYQIARRFFDVCRGLNELVLALFFVSAVGLGPFPGIMALAIHTVGIFGKLFSETIELVEPGQVDAIRATGASSLQVRTHGYWPQLMPNIFSIFLYRFESNVRAASLLGLVGAGGIGLYISEAVRSFNFPAAASILIVILISVFFIDFLSAKLRERLN